jgi:hypothetical protein
LSVIVGESQMSSTYLSSSMNSSLAEPLWGQRSTRNEGLPLLPSISCIVWRSQSDSLLSVQLSSSFESEIDESDR